MNKQPSKSWISHLESKKEQEEFNNRLLEGKDLFQRLGQLVEILKEKNQSKRISSDSYNKPAWSEFQADANGYERALTEVISLLKFTKE